MEELQQSQEYHKLEPLSLLSLQSCSFGAGAELPHLSCLLTSPCWPQHSNRESRAEHITCGTRPTGSHFSSLFPRFSSAATPLSTPINKAQNKKLWKPNFTISLKAAVSDGVNGGGGNRGRKQEMKVCVWPKPQVQPM